MRVCKLSFKIIYIDFSRTQNLNPKVNQLRENTAEFLPIEDRVSMNRDEDIFILRVDPQAVVEVPWSYSEAHLYSLGQKCMAISSAIPGARLPFLLK